MERKKPKLKVKLKLKLKSDSTNVVNVKVKYIRPKYDNLKEWMADENNVYIGRKGVILLPDDETGKKRRFPPENSVWANPFKIKGDMTREDVIQKYREYITEKLPLLKEDLQKLRGKTLGCWCKPEGCHGDVLIELLEMV